MTTLERRGCSVVLPHEVEMYPDGFQNLDSDQFWKDHEPVFEWTQDDLLELELEEEMQKQCLAAMAGWWDMEGVRCATFGRNPKQNPYRQNPYREMLKSA